MKHPITYAALILMVWISGCTVYHHITTTYNQEIDFNEYQTFAWAPDTLGSDKQVPDTAPMMMTLSAIMRRIILPMHLLHVDGL